MADIKPPLAGAAPKSRVAATATNVAGFGGMAVMAAALAVAGIKPDEGKWNVAKRDFAQGVPTECFGHTGPDVALGQHRTDAQCEAELSADVIVVRDSIVKCVPGLASRPYQWAASTRVAYNIGPQAFCRSGAAIAFRRGNWRTGCELFLPWDKARVNGKLIAVRGLTLRRQRERGQCLTGLAA